MNSQLSDNKVVECFVSYFGKVNSLTIEIDSIPDEKNRSTPDIDAIAGKYAIEHTSIDAIQNQRKDSSQYLQVIGSLEDELSKMIDYHIGITLPYSGIKIGEDWNKIKENLKAWIMNSAHSLPDGNLTLHDISGIPFSIHIDKSQTRIPGVFFSRFSPTDETFISRIFKQLTRKAEKLQPYQKQGFTTILLIESNDPALMNQGIILDSIKKAFDNRPPANVNLIWYAETYEQEEITFSDFTESISTN
ncbi:MAG: hypothetical protein ACI8ZB_000778 [Desulforhopalus sp.]|jgi:hypothetical protein